LSIINPKQAALGSNPTIGAIALLRVLWVKRSDYLRALFCALLRFKNRCTKYVKHPHTSEHMQNCLTLLLYTLPSFCHLWSYIPLEMFPHITVHTCVIVTETTRMKTGSYIIQLLRHCMLKNLPNIKNLEK